MHKPQFVAPLPLAFDVGQARRIVTDEYDGKGWSPISFINKG